MPRYATYSPVTKAPGDVTPTTAHQRASSSGTADVKTITLNRNTDAIFITVETTSARVTFDGSDPSAASAPSIVFPKDSIPVLIPVGPDAIVKWVSTAAAASVVQVFELT